MADALGPDNPVVAPWIFWDANRCDSEVEYTDFMEFDCSSTLNVNDVTTYPAKDGVTYLNNQYKRLCIDGPIYPTYSLERGFLIFMRSGR